MNDEDEDREADGDGNGNGMKERLLQFCLVYNDFDWFMGGMPDGAMCVLLLL